MRPRGRSAKRTPREWSVRIALASVLVVVGGFGVAFSFAQVIAKSDPARAHLLAPYDGQITAALAANLFADQHAIGVNSAPARLARAALRRDPIAVAAVSTLGLQAQARGDSAGARRLFAYAERLSRRNLVTQLWAIEDAVARGDVPGAIEQYDIALRTSAKAPDILFPILGSAIEVPEVRAGLIAKFRDEPIWAPGFLGYLAVTPKNPNAMAVLFADMRQHREAVPPAAIAAAIDGLYAAGAIDDAWRFYASERPRVDRRRSRDPGFIANLDRPSIFDWAPVNDGGLSTSIQQTAQGGLFDFAVPAGTGGTLLQQVQLLPPGDYRLSGHSIGIAQSENALPYWVLTCRDGRELGRVTVSNSAQAGGRFMGRFSVPAGCPAQSLALVARPSDSVGGLSGEIDRAALTPAI